MVYKTNVPVFFDHPIYIRLMTTVRKDWKVYVILSVHESGIHSLEMDSRTLKHAGHITISTIKFKTVCI